MPKLYVPKGGTANTPSKILVPFNSTTKYAKKAYGSLGGISKQIFPATGPGPAPGPFDPTNPDWNNLGDIVKGGGASGVLRLGQELPLQSNDGVIYLRVVGFDDATVTVGGSERTVHAIQLEGTSVVATCQWGSGAAGGARYEGSKIRGEILAFGRKADSVFMNNVGTSKVISYSRTSQGGYAMASYDKLFAESAAQLGINLGTEQQILAEGPVFQYYADGANSNRIKYDSVSHRVAVKYWTRTSNYVGAYQSYPVIAVNESGAGYSANGDPSYVYGDTLGAAFACNFTGIY